MSLIDSYIHEVSKRLHKNKREDIKLELKATIEDMLPESYSESDVKDVLQNLEVLPKLRQAFRIHLVF